MQRAGQRADDSRFCNTDLEDVTADDVHYAKFGDDPALWPTRAWAMLGRGDQMTAAVQYPNSRAYFAARTAGGSPWTRGVDPFRDVADTNAELVGETIWRQVLLLVRTFGGRDREATERAEQAALVRELFGDPFPPHAFAAGWRTSDVTELATSIYVGRARARLFVLADALEEAGCDSPAVLNHCRGPGGFAHRRAVAHRIRPLHIIRRR